MDEFKPMQFGPKLWICPSWCEAPDPSAVNILLDPGLAFGSGTHPTTSLCLQWLALHDLAKKQVIDYGCGSGILAIAAAKLGAAKITAVDLHPQALEATFDNATQNGVAEKIVIVSPEEFIEEPCDVLLANILAGPLMQLAPTFSTLVKPGGHLVLSGILHEQVPAILNCYASWFELSEPVFLEEWSLIHGVRR
jgi:ribosomal protein L11 methyltransferase